MLHCILVYASFFLLEKCISLMGFSPLGDGNADSSSRTPSQLAYGQSKPSVVGYTPARIPTLLQRFLPLEVLGSQLR